MEPWLTLIQTFGFPITVAVGVYWAFSNNKIVSGETHSQQAAQYERQIAAQATQFQARIDDMASQRDLLLDANMKNAHAADLALSASTTISARGAS